MTLIHFDNTHFNLLVSSNSRLFHNKENTEKKETPSSTEFHELKEKYEQLKTEHNSCLKELEILRKKNVPQKPEENEEESNKDTTMEESDNTEEVTLAAMKENGFTRIGPQNQAMQKETSILFSCKVCTQTFKTKTSLRKHNETHTTDGDWNCESCSFQTNSEGNLKKHRDAANHQSGNKEPSGIKCRFCEHKFSTADDLVIHKKKYHKSFKPCTNLPNCPYENDCMFNHYINSSKFTCYECGEEYDHMRDLMVHRKKHHKMNTCSKFIRNECMFTREACWYDHTDQNKFENVSPNMEHPEANKRPQSEEASQPPVFWERPANLIPPSINPSQATWVKMMSMMTDLNQMMTQIKNQNQFQ